MDRCRREIAAIEAHHDFSHNDANLDDQNHLICVECYIANPPLVDVEIIFAQVMVHMSDVG